MLLLLLIALNVHAESITRPASAIKAEASGDKLIIQANGKTVGTFDCLLSKPADYLVLNGLIQEAGANGAPITLDLKILGHFCELKRTQHRCLYDGKNDGCAPEEMKTLEKARKDGWDLLDLADDVPRFLKTKAQ